MTGRALDGRTALVTGATGGLGLAIAASLARAGAALVLNGKVEPDEARPAVEALMQEHGVPVRYERADLGHPHELEAMLAGVAAETAGVDILVNNAVTRHFASVEAFPPDRWNEALAVNISAPFHLMRLLLPGMRQRGYGRIFNMVSVYGLRGTPNRIDYVASKSALIGMTRAVALESVGQDVTCHAICPGSVLTPGTDDRVVALMADGGLSRAQAEKDFLRGKQPTGRFIDPNSVGDMIVFLCGAAGRDMTGGIVPIEGGWLAE